MRLPAAFRRHQHTHCHCRVTSTMANTITTNTASFPRRCVCQTQDHRRQCHAHKLRMPSSHRWQVGVLQESVNHLEDEREQFEATIADMRAQVLDQQAKISGYTREIGECARGSPSRIVRLACARVLEQQPRRMIENAMARYTRSNLRSAARGATICSHLSAQHTHTHAFSF
jgi:hypothetical protein